MKVRLIKGWVKNPPYNHINGLEIAFKNTTFRASFFTPESWLKYSPFWSWIFSFVNYKNLGYWQFMFFGLMIGFKYE